MDAQRNLELTVGAFVAAGLAALLYLALQVSGVSRLVPGEGYTVEARFGNVGALRVGAPVTMAGVRIGQVTAIRLDETLFEAVVELTIDGRYDQLPQDTSASVLTAGLLGAQYVGLQAGGLDEYLGAGDRIELTQSALVLENLIGRFLTDLGDDGGG